ncbi:MAG: efflux RND transporter periplasmic adaptor subunit [Myxococcales bacterium]|nr:MAG: efflux RND transporter periplasmic adaptor subunit [Myxococcales bacterium]
MPARAPSASRASKAAERELNDARAALESAQKEAVVHRAQLERAERLFRQELVSRIDVENARLDVEKDRIAQERAERAIAIARSAFEREREIARRGLSNAREVQAAEADVQAARLEADRARIALRSAQAATAGARAAVENTTAAYAALRGSGNRAEGGRITVAAPIGGRVVHREATVGQAVERTAELFEIDDLRTVFVTAQVPERQIVGLRRGASVAVTTAAYPGRRFLGTVHTIGGRLDPKTRTLPVQCLVPNADGALRPEMFAQVSLGEDVRSTALTVPRSAVFEEGG